MEGLYFLAGLTPVAVAGTNALKRFAGAVQAPVTQKPLADLKAPAPQFGNAFTSFGNQFGNQRLNVWA